jgi:hypothetical protein
MARPERTPPAPINVRKRLAWLLACVGLGALLGGVGSWLTGIAFWYIAIAGAVAVGWLFVADPSACEPSAPERGASQPAKPHVPWRQ